MQVKHVSGEHSWGINGDTGKVVDMKAYGLYESASVKVRACFTQGLRFPQQVCQIQILKTAVEAARMLLRVDDVVQAVRKERQQEQQGPPPEEMEG